MSTKPTPGPWIALPEECDRPYIRIRGTQLGGRYKVANVLTPAYEGVHESEAEQTRANARLIAAAPDLLEALEALVKTLGQSTMLSSFDRMQIDAARAAINKAKGLT